MKNIVGLIINLFLITISFSQEPCILGEVYVSEAANHGVPDDYIEVYNGGNVECTLAGFQLDDSEELVDFTFGNVILAPGDFWLGYENGADSFSSGLGADGDIVVFADLGGSMLIIIIEESIGMPELIILSEIAVRRHNNESLPNVKWFQTTLQISFTKVKSVLEPLQAKGFIIKSQAKGDHRVKDIDLTEKGFKFISEIMDVLPRSRRLDP